MKLQTVTGYLASSTQTTFNLRTREGEVSFSTPLGLPNLRENDMICVLIWDKAIVSVTNLSIGAECLYRPPQSQGGPYREGFLPKFDLLLALCTTAVSWSMLGKAVALHESVILYFPMAVLGFAFGVFALFGGDRTMRANAKLDDLFQERIRAVAADPSIWWDQVEEGESWKT